MDDLLTRTSCGTPAQPSHKRQYKRGETTSYNVCVERQHNYPYICGANWFAKQKDKYYCCAKHNQILMYPLMPTSTVRMNTALNLFSRWEWKPWFTRNPIIGKRLHHTVSRPMPWALPLNTISSVNSDQRKQIHQEYQFFFQTQIYNTPHVHPWRFQSQLLRRSEERNSWDDVISNVRWGLRLIIPYICPRARWHRRKCCSF